MNAYIEIMDRDDDAEPDAIAAALNKVAQYAPRIARATIYVNKRTKVGELTYGIKIVVNTGCLTYVDMLQRAPGAKFEFRA